MDTNLYSLPEAAYKEMCNDVLYGITEMPRNLATTLHDLTE